MLYPTELQAHGWSFQCWQLPGIYHAIFKTSRKQIRTHRLPVFVFASLMFVTASAFIEFILCQNPIIRGIVVSLEN